MKIPMLDLTRLHAPLAPELEAAFRDALGSSRYIQGPAVERFEGELAAHVGAAHAVGVSSGTDALLVTLRALGIHRGDEVITTPYTFFATAGSIVRHGGRPVFVDIEPASFNIDPAQVAAAITPRTVGIVPVHLFGRACAIEPLEQLAREHDLWLLEDAAQAIGARAGDRPVGGCGDAAAFSFFPAKNLGALGDAGAVTTDDAALAERLRALRQHGGQRKYYHDEVGGNFRLDALQAAFLSVKLPHLRAWEDGRRRVAARYRELLADVAGVVLPAAPPDGRHVYNQFVVRLPGARDRVQQALVDAGIGCAVYYPVPLHLQPCFAELGYGAGDCPEAERAAQETLALPIDPLLEEGAQEEIVAVLRLAIEGG